MATWDLINEIDIFRSLGGTGSKTEIVPRTYHKLGIDATRRKIELPPVESKIWHTDTIDYLVCDREFTWRTIPSEGTSWMSERPFKTLDDLYEISLQPLPESNILDKFIPMIEKTVEAYSKFGVVYIFSGSEIFDRLFHLLGWSLFIRALYQAKSKIIELMDKLTYIQEILAKGWSEFEAPAYFYCDDIAYKHGLMINPVFLREEWIPRIQKVIAPIKKKGMKAIFHSDGNIWGFIDDLIDAGFDGLNPLENLAGMEIGKVKERYGDELVLLGGVDCSYTLPLGSPIDVQKDTIEAIRNGAPGSGYCLGSSSELRAGTPLVNAVTMFKTVAKYGRYDLSKTRTGFERI